MKYTSRRVRGNFRRIFRERELSSLTRSCSGTRGRNPARTPSSGHDAAPEHRKELRLHVVYLPTPLDHPCNNGERSSNNRKPRAFSGHLCNFRRPIKPHLRR
ncbi:hypothetical protein RchiOBHm_Chr2g0171811 [Rosa chinensis]|uniref:Uncharacterized protein n=1 Tax=Rosa chinensis TaxID=74649 RepID=A0A2P6S5G6_ROSCH|nr:hypothetical protein RchiOBHm_Chr2g0171811 [Rosa chinensis]